MASLMACHPINLHYCVSECYCVTTQLFVLVTFVTPDMFVVGYERFVFVKSAMQYMYAHRPSYRPRSLSWMPNTDTPNWRLLPW